jgi:Protein of unknown function (DUF3551)
VPRFVLAIPVLAMALITGRSNAQTYDPHHPVCIHIYGVELGDRIECNFASFPECTASAVGLPATCFTNPNYAKAPVGAEGWRRRRDSNPR